MFLHFYFLLYTIRVRVKWPLISGIHKCNSICIICWPQGFQLKSWFIFLKYITTQSLKIIRLFGKNWYKVNIKFTCYHFEFKVPIGQRILSQPFTEPSKDTLHFRMYQLRDEPIGIRLFQLTTIKSSSK